MSYAAKREALQRRYIRTFPDKAARLRELGEAVDREGSAESRRALRAEAHKLAGSGGAYGFAEITDLARALEYGRDEALLVTLADLLAHLSALQAQHASLLNADTD